MPRSSNLRPIPLRRLALLGLALALLGPVARAQPPREPDKDEFGVPIRRPGLADRLRSGGPEWLAMLAEILEGGQAGPGRGWYERAISKTRHGWEQAASRFDRNKDGSISRAEFPGVDRDFKRLDRDRSGRLTPFDFEFPTNALYRSRSRMLMSFADLDHDGKIAQQEYFKMMFMGARDEYTRIRFFAESPESVDAAWKDSESMGVPFLSLGDLRASVDMEAVKRRLDGPTNPDGDVEKTTRATLWKSFARGELGSMHAGPGLGERAPDFTLPLDDGKGSVTLSKLLGSKPVILAFGSLTDPIFRADAGSLEKLARMYRGRAEFLMIYVREARPSDGWPSLMNEKERLSIPQPKDAAGRMKAARDLHKRLGMTMPIAVDALDDRVGILYSGLPDRLYMLDPEGRVAYQGGRGPFGFKPDELESSLILQLQDGPAPAR